MVNDRPGQWPLLWPLMLPCLFSLCTDRSCLWILITVVNTGGRYDGVSESKCRIYKYLWVLLSILCIPPSIGFILYISCYMRLCASVMEYQCRQVEMLVLEHCCPSGLPQLVSLTQPVAQ